MKNKELKKLSRRELVEVIFLIDTVQLMPTKDDATWIYARSDLPAVDEATQLPYQKLYSVCR